jgi:hypothetical protein
MPSGACCAADDNPDNINANDVMGLFIWPKSAPSNYTNVALVPDTPDTPVMVISVNRNNNSGLLADFPAGGAATEMEGVTRELTTRPYQVTAGVTYRIKLAVADGNDPIADSVRN